MMKALAVGVVLSALYAGHVQWSPLVYQDSNLLRGAETPFTWSGGLLRMRGLSGYSWRLVQSPRASHALSLALHVVVVGLVGLLFWRLTHDRFTAWAVALISAFHPLTIEPVAYAASRADLMAACGVALVLLCVTSRGWWWVGAVPALAFAAASKETGLVAIGLCPLVLWYQGRYRAARLTGLLALGAGVSVLPWLGEWAAVGEYGALRIDAVTWFGVQAAAVWRLGMLSVAPLWLSVSPDIPMSGWVFSAALILLVGLVEGAWRVRHRLPLLTLGIVGCAIVAAPRFLVRTPTSPFNEHQWYLAMPFVACGLVAGLTVLADRLDDWRSPCRA